jgi:hypothetical protein
VKTAAYVLALALVVVSTGLLWLQFSRPAAPAVKSELAPRANQTNQSRLLSEANLGLGDDHPLYNVAISPDGLHVLLAYEDRLLIRDTIDWTDVQFARDRPTKATWAIFCPDNRCILSSDRDGGFCLWELEAGKEILGAEFLASSPLAAMGSPQGAITELFAPRRPFSHLLVGTSIVRRFQGHNGPVTVDVIPTVAAQFSVTIPAHITAGSSFTFTVTAEDQFKNCAPTYAGTVAFASTDNGTSTVLPPSTTLTGGLGTFSATLTTAGPQSLHAQDMAVYEFYGFSAIVPVSSAAPTHFSVTATPSATAGSGLEVTVTAFDQFNNLATGYSGTVSLTNSYSSASLPTSLNLTSGIGFFSTTLYTAGNVSITAVDTTNSSISAGSGMIPISAASPSMILIFVNDEVAAGDGEIVTVELLDRYDNLVQVPGNTVSFESSDSQAGLPGTTSIGSGYATVTITFGTIGSQTITALADDLHVTSQAITVDAGPVSQLTFSNIPGAVIPGQEFDVTVIAADGYGNMAASYSGYVTWTTDTGWIESRGDTYISNGSATATLTLNGALMVGDTVTIIGTTTDDNAYTGSFSITIGGY